MIEGQRPRPAGQKKDQDRSPEQVLGPGLRVDEGLDHGNHAEQRQGCEPRREAYEQENRKGQLVESGEARRPERIDERHLVFVLEELQRKLPGVDLEQAGIEEDRPDGNAHGQLDDRERETSKEVPHRDKPAAQGRNVSCTDDMGRRHGPAPWLGRLTAAARPSARTAASARPGSKVASDLSASSAAEPMVCPAASASRNTKVAGSRRSIRNSPRAPRISSCTSAGSKT